MKGLAAFVLVLLLVVIVHEFGHFAVGKLSGIRIDEFAVGFGPRLWSFRGGETVYALRAIPAGGFVRLAGMTGLEHDEAGERSFFRATIPRRMATIAAGGLINLVLAGLLFGIAGIPGVASYVARGGGAERAGMHSGDVLLSVNGHPLDAADEDAVARAIRSATFGSHGGPIAVGYQDSSGARHSTSVSPQLFLFNYVGAKDDPSGGGTLPPGPLVITAVNGRPVPRGDAAALLGGGGAVTVSGHEAGVDNPRRFTDHTISEVTPTAVDSTASEIGRLQAAWRIGYAAGRAQRSVPAAFVFGATQVPVQARTMLVTIGQAISRPGSGGLTGPLGASGPVGIYQATSAASESGWTALVALGALLSLNLGVINLLPIPFLDGGRFLFIIIEAVRRRRVDPQLEAMVHFAGLAVIVSFALYITIFGDIGRLVNPS